MYELTHRVVPPDDECFVVWALPCDVRAEVRLATKKASSASAPPAMERMCSGPCGEGANSTRQGVESGGMQRAHRCSRLGCFVITKGCSA